MTALPPALAATLDVVAVRMAMAVAPWWMIGSAAMALHGVSADDVRDVDIMTGHADARRLLDAYPSRAGGAARRFRSDPFGRWTGLPLPVEIMGGFAIDDGDGAEPVTIAEGARIDWNGGALNLPSRTELLRLCALFGRPKDRVRAESLRALGTSY